jgi:hypothetical protein
MLSLVGSLGVRNTILGTKSGIRPGVTFVTRTLVSIGRQLSRLIGESGNADARLALPPLRSSTQEGDVTEKKSPAVKSLEQEQKAQRKEEREMTVDQKLEKALKDTFPASDPVAEQVPVIPGGTEDKQ